MHPTSSKAYCGACKTVGDVKTKKKKKWNKNNNNNNQKNPEVKDELAYLFWIKQEEMQLLITISQYSTKAMELAMQLRVKSKELWEWKGRQK